MTATIITSLIVSVVLAAFSHWKLRTRVRRELSHTIVLYSFALGLAIGFIVLPIILLVVGYFGGMTLTIQGLPAGLSQDAFVITFLLGGVVTLWGRVWDYLELWRA